MTGRRHHSSWHELKFIPVKKNNKNYAKCKICKKSLSNTSVSRLKIHRNICVVDPTDIDSETETICGSIEDIEIEFIDESHFTRPDDVNLETTTNKCDGIGSCDSPVQTVSDVILLNSPSSSTTQHLNRKSSSQSLIDKCFLDKTTVADSNRIDEKLGAFFFGCNIPFSVVESDHIKTLIKELRPAYQPPSRKVLSTKILDNLHAQVTTEAQAIGENSVLIIDGWKNTANNTKNVATLLQNTDGVSVFLDSFDFTTTRETADELKKVVNQSIEIAKSIYKSEPFAVVSDNAAAMRKMGRNVTLWKFYCSSHTGNLLAKDVVDKGVAKNVVDIVKEFKHPDLEKKIINLGGTRLITICETRWCSHRNAFEAVRKNIPHMRAIAAEDGSKIKQNVIQLIFNENIIQQLNEQIALLDPICTLVNICQKSTSSIADAAEQWLAIEKNFPISFIDRLRLRQAMVLNVETLAANFFHPIYQGKLLSDNQKDEIDEYFIEVLDSVGLEEYNCFKEKTGRFQQLFQKNIQNPKTFWNLAKNKYPKISKFAMRLLSVPASSAEIERVFSEWSFVHNDKRNRLTPERSKKLLSVYHNLKAKDKNKTVDY